MLLDSVSEENKGKIMSRLHISYLFSSVAWLPIYPLCVCVCVHMHATHSCMPTDAELSRYVARLQGGGGVGGEGR